VTRRVPWTKKLKRKCEFVSCLCIFSDGTQVVVLPERYLLLREYLYSKPSGKSDAVIGIFTQIFSANSTDFFWFDSFNKREKDQENDSQKKIWRKEVIRAIIKKFWIRCACNLYVFMFLFPKLINYDLKSGLYCMNKTKRYAIDTRYIYTQ
jgi:hypothetical protein